jgi:ribosomal-protein-alanine N-acetyltransferase
MHFTPPPTPRLEFGRWTSSDVALAASLWADPEVMRFIGGPYTDEEVAARIEKEVASETARGIQYWPLFARESGEFVGCCGLKPHDPDPREYEIGFQLRPPFWGRGYAAEAARAVIAHTFGTLQATALFAGHHPENTASAALLAKLGFECIGTHFFARTGLDHPWHRLLP